MSGRLLRSRLGPFTLPLAACAAAALFLMAAGTNATALPVDIPIVSDLDDGVEFDHSVWMANLSPLPLGRDDEGTTADLGLRFLLPGFSRGDTLAYARLRFSSRGGHITDSLDCVISALLDTTGEGFSQERRPSMLPGPKPAKD
jgi:hypothetical protein